MVDEVDGEEGLAKRKELLNRIELLMWMKLMTKSMIWIKLKMMKMKELMSS